MGSEANADDDSVDDGFDLELFEDSQWGEVEEAAFTLVSADNVHVLREIESRMPSKFMRKWTAQHLMCLMWKAEADAGDPLGNLELQT